MFRIHLPFTVVAGLALLACGSHQGSGQADTTALAAPAPSEASAPTPAEQDGASNPATVAPPGAIPTASFRAVDAANAFTFEMTGKLAAQEPGNFVVSPLSVATALTMTWGGAKGNTAAELGAALHLAGPAEAVHRSVQALSGGLASAKRVELRLANRLFGAAGASFEDAFLALTRERYGAELQPVDFGADGGEAARTIINDWISSATKAKIPTLIPQGLLDGMTRLVLTNAVYFKGDWAKAFDPDETLPAPFNVSPDRAVPAQFMQHPKISLPYRVVSLGDAGGYAVLTLPYQGDRFAMTVVLPDAGTDVGAAWAHFGQTRATGSPAQPSDVRVLLPRFEMRFNTDLVPLLKTLGVRDAFGDGADLSGINGKTNLYISAVVHEGWIAVDETGTEAAAATAVVATRKAAPRVTQFRADRPFFYLITDAATGAIVFVGRVSDPTAG